jgi:thiol:disulfide interchange protein DsbC
MNFAFMLCVFMLVSLPLQADAFETKGQDCQKCHTLNNDEASALLQIFDPNIKVVSVRESSAKGFWEVAFDAGKKGLVYIDFTKKHLFSGSLIQLEGKKNLTQDRLSDLNKVDVSQIPLKDALVVGSTQAKNKVVVFDDPE